MTSRALKIKSPAFGFLGATLRKNIGAIILLSVAMLIFCPGFFITVLSETVIKPENYTSPDTLNSLYGVTVVFSCIFVCVANYVNFAFLYKKSSSDVFHALPLTRVSLLFSRTAAGFIGVLIPVTIGYIALAFLTIPYPTYVVGTIPQIFSAYLINVLLMLAFSAFSLIFIVCAGSGFDLVLSFGGFNLAALAVGAIINTLCENHLSGYSNEFTGFLRVFSPIYYLAEKAVFFAEGNYALKGSADIIFGILKYAAVFFIVAPLLYNFRKAERGEQAYAYKFIYVICGVLAGICGGYALSEIFTFAADTREYSVIGFVTFVIGALITTVVYGAVTDRGFKGFKQSMAVGGISALVYAIVAVIIMSGAFGFEKRVPAVKDVTAVTVNFDNISVDFKDPSAAIALHKAIIDKNADDEFKDDVDESHVYVFIDYNLSGKGDAGNGDMLRNYYVKESAVNKELFNIYASDERFADIYEFIEKAGKVKLNVSGDYNGSVEESEYLGGYMSADTAKNIISVYRKELNALGDEFFTEKQQTSVVATLYLDVEINDGYDSIDIYTTADFPETNRLISEYIESDVQILH
ncbi:MAG: hypothetical protein J6T73_01685 [Clostridia bacterium]|nr:hypothetical protein [Clostridia bacterium]